MISLKMDWSAGQTRGVTCADIDAKVLAGAVLEGVLLAQLVEHVGGVKAGVVAELARDDLQGARKRDHEQLLPPRDRARMVSQPPAHRVTLAHLS